MTRDQPDPPQRRKIGARIRRVRIGAGLRQWQLAELVGATQPSICMYERGVLPDAARLLSIARIGGTTVEWLLTGRHCTDGPDEMERLPPALYELARIFHGVSEDERAKLVALMDRIRIAIASLEQTSAGGLEAMGVDAIAKRIGELPRGDRRSLGAAAALQAAVVRRFFARGMRSLERGTEEESRSGRRAFLDTRSIVPIKGPMVRLSRGLHVLVEILERPEGRAELAEILSRMSRRLRPGRKRPARPRSRSAAAPRPSP